MTVTQQDARTIRVRSDSGLLFRVPYRLHWNGSDREPASIVLQETPARRPASTIYDVRAFFLFGEIRDRITSDAVGIRLARTWSIQTPGPLLLSIDLEMDITTEVRGLFPGVHILDAIPDQPLSFLGDKTSYPASLMILVDERGLLIHSRRASLGTDLSSIGVHRALLEDEQPVLQVELRFPGVEEPASRLGPRPDQKQPPVPVAIVSPGTLERVHELFLAFAPREELLLEAASAALRRSTSDASPRKGETPRIDPGRFSEAIDRALGTHLVEDGGVAGIREVPESSWLSSGAGLGLALAIRKLHPADARLRELALRLADFSLRGQLPSGMFFESYSLETGQWSGVRGSRGQTLLSIAHSSRIAELLLRLAAQLELEGRPSARYALAAVRMVEFYLDEKGRLSMPGSLHRPDEREPIPEENPSGGLDLFFPMALLWERTHRDRYRKPLNQLVQRFSSIPWDPYRPSSSRSGRDPDSAAALRAVHQFVEMRRLGYKVAEPPVSTAAEARARGAETARLFSSLLVPWIRLDGPPDAPADEGDDGPEPGAGGAPEPAAAVAPAVDTRGCLADSHARHRSLFAGYQTAYLLLRLRELVADRARSALLLDLARLCLTGGSRAPLGAAWVQHSTWDVNGNPQGARGRLGPVDSRRLASEIVWGLRVLDEYPEAAGAGARPKRAR